MIMSANIANHIVFIMLTTSVELKHIPLAEVSNKYIQYIYY